MSETALDAPSNEFDRLTELTKHCIVHATMVLAPRGVKLPSGSHKIERFCQEILGSINNSKKAKKKKQTAHLPVTNLIPEVEILNFYEGVSSFEEFAIIVCSHILQATTGDDDFDQTKIHLLCWEHYSEYYKAEISYPKWFSNDDLLHLWLIFCSHLSSLSTLLDADIMNDILQRITEKASFTWNDGFRYDQQTPLDFLNFLSTLVDRFIALQINSSVIGEIIIDLRDEIINGVLRKGYLFKKGHQVRNWKRRFFILTRRSLTYYESREKMLLKGSLFINHQTKTEVLEDKGDKKQHRFLVTCGNSGTEYVMCADDSRTRNEWLLDIAKAIQLEQALNRSTESEITNSIASFYQLKYGTAVPNLTRLDSTLRHATMGSSQNARMRIKQLSGTISVVPSELSDSRQNSVESPSTPHSNSHAMMIDNTPLSESMPPQEEGETGTAGDDFYEEMSGGAHQLPGDNSDDDDDAYTFMFQGKGEGGGEGEGKSKERSKSLERAIKLSLSVLQQEDQKEETPAATTTISNDNDTINQLEESSSTSEGKVQDDLYEECDISSPRYIPPPSNGYLEESHESHLESISELLKVDLSPQHSSSQHASTITSTHSSTSSINYMPVLPDMINRNNSLDSPPIPVPRPSPRITPSPRKSRLRMSTELSSPPTSPVRTEMESSELYYITPPPVPSHRGTTRGHS